MPDISIRPFQRRDRDQVTSLVNRHLAAILPGLSVSANAVLAQFEREPEEYVVDPWVVERRVLVAESQHNVYAAALLVRYGTEEAVGPNYRGAAEIRWLVCFPDADGRAAGALLLQGCLAQFRRWLAAREFANGALPAPGAYGVPDVWPHIQALLAEAGFGDGKTEEVFAAQIVELPRHRSPPWSGLRLVRSVAGLGVRFAAVDGERELGYCEVDTMLGEPGRFAPGQRIADISNLWVEPDVRRRGIGRWLLATVADWLDRAGVSTLLGYLDSSSSAAERAFLAAAGLTPMVTTTRGLQRRTSPDQILARPG